MVHSESLAGFDVGSRGGDSAFGSYGGVSPLRASAIPEEAGGAASDDRSDLDSLLSGA